MSNDPSPGPNPNSCGRFTTWLASPGGRIVLLVLAACFSLPAALALPGMGIDPSWQLSLQLAAIHHKVFGQDFVFTYGPLGWLMIHAAVNKAVLLLYDLFILASVLSIYRAVLPERPRPVDALVLAGLVAVTKACITFSAPAACFTVLCYWLWRVYDGGHGLAVVGALAAALVLFFGKVNYGIIMLFMVPGYGLGLLLFQRRRIVQGLLLIFGFPLLVWLGCGAWHVDLRNYLHSGLELVAGYNEAMFTCPSWSLFALELACVFLAAMAVVVLIGIRRLPWRDHVMSLPLIGLAGLLLFKNAFVRSDPVHNPSFFIALPLLLAVWSIAWRGACAVRVLLIASLFQPVGQITTFTRNFARVQIFESLPLSYVHQMLKSPWREHDADLEAILREDCHRAIMPPKIRDRLGDASVDVMPWESSLAVLNGLKYQPRPIPQAYSAYTPWLDDLNARFLASTNAPDCVLFTATGLNTIDYRPAAWDEAATRRALLENYSFDSDFTLPIPILPFQNVEDATIYILRHTPQARRLVPIATNEVTLAPGQVLSIPDTTNLVYLTLDVKRSLPGKLKASALWPSLLTVTFNYQDGTTKDFWALLPILKTGVLVNRRVESAQEIRRLLEVTAFHNDVPVTSLTFNTTQPWAFRPPFHGTLVEYRVVEQ